MKSDTVEGMNRSILSSVSDPLRVRSPLSRRARALPIVVAAAATLMLTGCGDDLEITGGQGGNEDGFVVDDGMNDGETNGSGDAGDGTANSAPVGTIEVKIDEGGKSEFLHFDAAECAVSPDGVTGRGSFTEGQGSIRIDTLPHELLHKGTGTWQAAGAIQLDAAGRNIVADGRLDSLNLESMFTYRVSGSSVTYTVTWYDVAGAETHGYVKMSCS